MTHVLIGDPVGEHTGEVQRILAEWPGDFRARVGRKTPAFAPDLDAIESLSYSLRKVLKNRGTFPSDESILQVLYLGMQNVAKKWTMPIRDWKAALNQFVILFGDRVPV